METGASSFPQPVDEERKKRIWTMLSRSEELDKFLGKKFPNLKRYGEYSSTRRMRADADPVDRLRGS